MNREKSWEQLAKYFAGELNGEEQEKMESWIKANPEREAQTEQLRRIWKESETPPYHLNVDEAWSRLSGNMKKVDLEFGDAGFVPSGRGRLQKLHTFRFQGRRIRRAGSTSRRVILAAAAVLLIFTAALFTYYSAGNTSQEMMAGADHHILETQQGERASYQLSDGSRVILHAGSRLEIPDNYNHENRELFLEGEAYFETVHDPEKPFIVHSQDTFTRVLGTRFLVQAWSGEERNVEVIVSEGKVLFGDSKGDDRGEEKETFITQNQRAVLSGDSGPVVSDITDLDWYLGWTEGRLVFENRPLSEVLPKLERWYDITLDVEEESIKAKTITAEIDYSLPMSDVLMGLAMSLGLEYEQEGRTGVFRSWE